MTNNPKSGFFEAVLDGMPHHIAIVNQLGRIEWVNSEWRQFAAFNDARHGEAIPGTDDIGICTRAGASSDEVGLRVREGFDRVSRGESSEFSLEYPWPTRGGKDERWFLMKIRPLMDHAEGRLLVLHEDITDRKRAEIALEKLAVTDPLTGLANRRRLETALDAEINRAQRSREPLSLVMVDIDFFKRYNDTYGHPAGDACLERIGPALKEVAKRPNDIASRYGGEEFAILWPQTDQEDARKLAEELLVDIRNLNIAHERNPPRNVITVSIGLATMIPNRDTTNRDLITLADEALYKAKAAGKDQLVIAEIHARTS
jgi:diguanylate cyclase (GGDEF)-like protein